MASVFPAPIAGAIAIPTTNVHSAAPDGIRKRRTPSEEAATVVGADIYATDAQNRENAFDNDAFVGASLDGLSSRHNPTVDLMNTDPSNAIAPATTPKSRGERFWSWWKRCGSITRRLTNTSDLFRSSIIFRCPASLRCCSFLRRGRHITQYRSVIPNHLFTNTLKDKLHPNRRYAGNKIKTTKYTIFTFLPKNLFEQFHRFANLYFVFIVLLNWIPEIEAVGKELAVIPVLFVLAVTAVKDIYEDRRRYLADRKVNHATCRVFNAQERRYVRTEWKDVVVGDFVHLSCNETIPADILFVHSSDPAGVCYVETSNLDGESNLKQRHIIASLLDKQGERFSPTDFTSTIECEQPNNQIYKFSGFLLHSDGQREIVNKNNLLLRGCEVRNTDFIEGIVVYAGHETKALLNNSGPRYKRSKLERLMNWDIVWCVVVLLIMCFVGALGGGIWLSSFDEPHEVQFLAFIQDKATMNPELEGFLVFWTYIIIMQVMIPISLYVSIEIVKLGQIFFITQDDELYYAPAKKRIQCRALNIPEELGQIEYVMSDKTGTLTENQMIFRRCAIAGVDYGSSDLHATKEHPDATNKQTTKETSKDVKVNMQLQQMVIAACYDQGSIGAGGDSGRRQTYFDFFINMAICNTVVVNPHPHADRMNACGVIADDSAGGDTPTLSYGGDTSGTATHSLLLKTAAPNPAPALVGQTPVDFPSPRYAMDHNQKCKTDISTVPATLPTIITTDHATMVGPASGQSSSDDHSSEGDALETGKIDATASTSKQSGDTDEISSLPAVETSKSRPSTLQLGKKLLQLPMLAKGRLPPMGGKKTPIGAPSPGYRNPVYEAESPDELALVYASAAYGFRLVKRHTNSITVDLPTGELLKYQVLYVLPFDSVRKRMSVIVKNPKTKKIELFCKGADSTVMELLSEQFSQSQRGQMYIYKCQEYLSLYASYGLRTLCMAKRELPQDEYEQWAALHEDAEMSLDDDREQLIFESALSIEKDLELVGISGIEDRLQDGVADCIAGLRLAGIKVWVLTGDKIETAVNIAYACKLFAYGMELIQLCTRNEEDADTLVEYHLERITRRDLERNARENRAYSDNIAIVVDGQTLAYFLTPKLEGKFVQLVSHCTSLLCCRTTPLQKASVVRLVKEKLEAVTLAIGDGANDVTMIQCADVGIGVSGQEGMQAVMASDFAMPQFRFLRRLLMVHGHWCYDRLARMVLYFFYKNAMFVFTCFWYQFFNGFTAQVMIDPLYLMLHNLVFTSLPPLLLGVFDQDAPAEMLLEQQALYQQGQKGLIYQTHSFWLNILDALWQSVVCYFIPHFMYTDSDEALWSFGFLISSALVLCNQSHLLLTSRSWTLPIVVSVMLSNASFYGFALCYNALAFACCAPDSPMWVAERMVGDVEYWLAILCIIVLALFPRFVFATAVNTFFTSNVLTARIRHRLKRKKSKSNRFAPWIVKFTSKTKSVTLTRQPARSTQVAQSENVNAGVECDRAPSSNDADTA